MVYDLAAAITGSDRGAGSAVPQQSERAALGRATPMGWSTRRRCSCRRENYLLSNDRAAFDRLLPQSRRHWTGASRRSRARRNTAAMVRRKGSSMVRCTTDGRRAVGLQSGVSVPRTRSVRPRADNGTATRVRRKRARRPNSSAHRSSARLARGDAIAAQSGATGRGRPTCRRKRRDHVGSSMIGMRPMSIPAPFTCFD